MSRVTIVALVATLVGVVLLLSDGPARACTRAVYHGNKSQPVTGRSMNWIEDMGIN
jgi:penicillin V acylase-like amidase (Ntn superfamily)